MRRLEVDHTGDPGFGIVIVHGFAPADVVGEFFQSQAVKRSRRSIAQLMDIRPDSATVSRILAGNTKPYLRTIGAPYWAVNRSWGNRVQDVIELTRMERSWCGEGKLVR